jgi:hypothetical protein
MKKIAVVLIPLLVLVLVLGALGCSKTVYVVVTPTPTVAPTPTQTVAPTPSPSPSPTPTLSPTSTPTATPMPPPTPDTLSRPCAFNGSVLINGVNAPNGTVVTVIVAGYGYSTTTTTVSGASHYYIQVPKAAGITYEGQTVTFMLNNVMTTQTSTWSEGFNKPKNLTSP